MESYLNKNFGGVKAKHSSDEALRRWRKAVGIVKNPKRRFRYTANLDKRSEAAAMKRSNRVRTSSLVKRVLTSLLFMKMESYLDENFGGVKAKHSSDEALRRWRKAVGVVKNPKRRFRYTANLDKHSEAAAMKRSNREKLRKLRVAKAALQFIHGLAPRASTQSLTTPRRQDLASVPRS